MPNPIGPIRSGLTPQGRDDNTDEHRCGRCVGPYGKSNLPCPNEPKETAL